jgi:hypothetical protein
MNEHAAPIPLILSRGLSEVEGPVSKDPEHAVRPSIRRFDRLNGYSG